MRTEKQKMLYRDWLRCMDRGQPRDWSRRVDWIKSVISAGSVVTRDLMQGVFAAGKPCRVIQKSE